MGDGWGCCVKNKKASGVCWLHCMSVQLSLHMETAGYVCLNCWYTHESVKAEAKKETDLPSAAALSAARWGTGCRGVLLLDIFIGCFYLSMLTGEVSWRGFFGGFSRTSCSGFYSAFCFTF